MCPSFEHVQRCQRFNDVVEIHQRLFCQGGFYSPAAAPAVGLLNRRFAGGGRVAHAGFFLA